MTRTDMSGALLRRLVLALAALVGLCAGLAPRGDSSASGPIWLAMQQATAAPFVHLHPALATSATTPIS